MEQGVSKTTRILNVNRLCYTDGILFIQSGLCVEQLRSPNEKSLICKIQCADILPKFPKIVSLKKINARFKVLKTSWVGLKEKKKDIKNCR